MNRLDRRGYQAGSRHVLAPWADTEDLKVMTMDREVRIAGKVPKKVIEGASGECHHGAALGADEVVAVSRLPDDIGGMTTGLEEAGQEINRREDLKRAIDGRATDRWQLLHELLGGKWAAVGKDGL